MTEKTDIYEQIADMYLEEDPVGMGGQDTAARLFVSGLSLGRLASDYGYTFGSETTGRYMMLSLSTIVFL